MIFVYEENFIYTLRGKSCLFSRLDTTHRPGRVTLSYFVHEFEGQALLYPTPWSSSPHPLTLMYLMYMTSPSLD